MSDVENRAELWQALLAAQKAVDNVAREGRNSAQNYDFATAEDVMTEARTRLHAEGLILTFSESSHQVRDTERQDKKTGQIVPGATVATVVLTMTLTHAASSQTYEFTVSGEGADYGDKALPKAYTNAVKYGCRHLLLIPFGEDPENDSPERGKVVARKAPAAQNRNLATEKQAAMLYAKSRAAGMDNEVLRKALEHACGSGVKTCDQVPRGKVDDVVSVIDRWAEKHPEAAEGGGPPAEPSPADEKIPF